MYKKKLITLLMIGVCLSGYAQKNIYSTREEAAKVAAINAQTKLLDQMQAQLKNSENKPKFSSSDIQVKKDTLQFLYEENKLADLLSFKIDNTGSIKTNDKGEKKEVSKKKKADYGLRNVFSKLCVLNANNSNPTTLRKEKIQLDSTCKIKFKYDPTKEKTDSSVLIVPVSFEVYTTANKNISNAKYKVTGEWHITLVEDKMEVSAGTKKKDSHIGYKAKKNVLESFAVKPIAYLSSEVVAMQKAARDAIVEWYKYLPKKLEQKYINMAIDSIHSMTVAQDRIAVDRPNNRMIFVTQTVEIPISVDPHPYMKEPDIYYENPTAILKLKPTFTVEVGENLMSANITHVSYEEVLPDMIPTLTRKLEMRDSANRIVNALAEQLANYVSSPDAEYKKALWDMFVSSDGMVQVSHKYKNGKEKISSKNAEKYLNHLKGTNLTFVNSKMMDENMVNKLNDEHPELGLVFDANLNTVMYLINQKYESKTYKDSTDKIVFLNYNDENERYFINKIAVVPNSTKIE